MSMTSLSPGPLFQTAGFNKNHTPAPIGSTSSDVHGRYKKTEEKDAFPDSPVAEIYDVQNSPAKLVILNNNARAKDEETGSHLRVHSAGRRSQMAPTPSRHSAENTPRTNSARHEHCLDSSSPRYVPSPPPEPPQTKYPQKSSESRSRGGSSVGGRRSRIEASDSIPQDLEFYKRYYQPARVAPAAKKPPISMSDNRGLVDKRLSLGNRRYLWTVASVYDISDLRRSKQIQYQELLLKQTRLGFHSEKDYQKYVRYFQEPRKRLFSTPQATQSHKRRRSASPSKKRKDKKQGLDKEEKETDSDMSEKQAAEDNQSDHSTSQKEKPGKKYNNHKKETRAKSAPSKGRKETPQTKEKNKSANQSSKKEAQRVDKQTQKNKDDYENLERIPSPPPSSKPSTENKTRKAYNTRQNPEEPKESKESTRGVGDGEAEERDQVTSKNEGKESQENEAMQPRKVQEKETTTINNDSQSTRPNSGKHEMKFLGVLAGTKCIDDLSEGTEKESSEKENEKSEQGNDSEKEDSQPRPQNVIVDVSKADSDDESAKDKKGQHKTEQSIDEKETGSSLSIDSRDTGSENSQKLSPREGYTRPKSRLGNRPIKETTVEQKKQVEVMDHFELEDTPRTDKKEEKVNVENITIDPRNAAVNENIENKPTPTSKDTKSHEKHRNVDGRVEKSDSEDDFSSGSEEETSDEEDGEEVKGEDKVDSGDSVSKVIVVERKGVVKVTEAEAAQDDEVLDDKNNNNPDGTTNQDPVELEMYAVLLDENKQSTHEEQLLVENADPTTHKSDGESGVEIHNTPNKGSSDENISSEGAPSHLTMGGMSEPSEGQPQSVTENGQPSHIVSGPPADDDNNQPVEATVGTEHSSVVHGSDAGQEKVQDINLPNRDAKVSSSESDSSSSSGSDSDSDSEGKDETEVTVNPTSSKDTEHNNSGFNGNSTGKVSEDPKITLAEGEQTKPKDFDDEGVDSSTETALDIASANLTKEAIGKASRSLIDKHQVDDDNENQNEKTQNPTEKNEKANEDTSEQNKMDIANVKRETPSSSSDSDATGDSSDSDTDDWEKSPHISPSDLGSKSPTPAENEKGTADHIDKPANSSMIIEDEQMKSTDQESKSVHSSSRSIEPTPVAVASPPSPSKGNEATAVTERASSPGKVDTPDIVVVGPSTADSSTASSDTSDSDSDSSDKPTKTVTNQTGADPADSAGTYGSSNFGTATLDALNDLDKAIKECDAQTEPEIDKSGANSTVSASDGSSNNKLLDTKH